MTMKLKELYDLAPQAAVFIVRRDDENKVTDIWEYHGGRIAGDREVTRITPASGYPMYEYVLEVELKPCSWLIMKEEEE